MCRRTRWSAVRASLGAPIDQGLVAVSQVLRPKKAKYPIYGNEAVDILAYVLGDYRGAHNLAVGTLRLDQNLSHLEGASRCLIRYSDRLKAAQRDLERPSDSD